MQKGHAFRRGATEEKIQVDSRIIGCNDVAEFRVDLNGEGKSRQEPRVMVSSLVSRFIHTGGVTRGYATPAVHRASFNAFPPAYFRSIE